MQRSIYLSTQPYEGLERVILKAQRDAWQVEVFQAQADADKEKSSDGTSRSRTANRCKWESRGVNAKY